MWKRHILVVANVTAASDQLVLALKEMTAQQPATFTLLVPATIAGGGRDQAVAALEDALDRFTEAGLTTIGQLGDADPLVAVSEAFDPREIDEIVVSTLPLGSSKWMHAGLPERIAKLTGAPVTHIVARPAPLPHATSPAPAHHAEPVMLAPFAAIGRAQAH